MPRNNQLDLGIKLNRHYIGKKVRHTQKAHVIIHQHTLEIIATASGNGSIHENCLFNDYYAGMAKNVQCIADTGYLGLTKLNANSPIPPIG